MSNPFVDITGQKFGRLTAIEPAGVWGASRSLRWRCRCDCGRESVTLGIYLRQGRTKSCGCTRGPQGPTGSRKKRPTWATEENLRRIILGPSLKYLQVCIAYYRQRKTYPEIARETGIKADQLAFITQRVRRAMGAKPEPKGEVVGALPSWRHGEEWNEGRVMQKDQRGARQVTTVPDMYSDTKLRACILTVALQRLELARQYWLENRTIVELATATGLTKSAVGLRLWQLKRSMEQPKIRCHRERVSLTRLRRINSENTY